MSFGYRACYVIAQGLCSLSLAMYHHMRSFIYMTRELPYSIASIAMVESAKTPCRYYKMLSLRLTIMPIYTSMPTKSCKNMKMLPTSRFTSAVHPIKIAGATTFQQPTKLR